MARASRDRISVDLRGMKPALMARAHLASVSPSDVVRAALANALGQPLEATARVSPMPRRRHEPGQVRLCLRLQREDAQGICAAARRAGLTPGAYVVGLCQGVPALTAGPTRPETLAALTASTAELSSFRRNLNHLCALLRTGEYRAAQEYHVMLDSLAADVGSHLTLAARALADLKPQPLCTTAPNHRLP